LNKVKRAKNNRGFALGKEGQISCDRARIVVG
jgi:hypothetical protein